MDQATVLILDQDVGFVFWLGEVFSEAGCRAVPAFNGAQAASTIEELNLTVDVVVINPGLAWVPQVLSTLGAQFMKPKIVLIHDDESNAVGTVHANAVLKRPTASHPVSRHEMLERVREILRRILDRKLT